MFVSFAEEVVGEEKEELRGGKLLPISFKSVFHEANVGYTLVPCQAKY